MYTVIDTLEDRNIEKLLVEEGREGFEAIDVEFMYHPHILTAAWEEKQNKKLHVLLFILLNTEKYIKKVMYKLVLREVSILF